MKTMFLLCALLAACTPAQIEWQSTYKFQGRETEPFIHEMLFTEPNAAGSAKRVTISNPLNIAIRAHVSCVAEEQWLHVGPRTSRFFVTLAPTGYSRTDACRLIRFEADGLSP